MRDEQLIALAHVANDYHSGQWSRGYRLLCHTLRVLRLRGFERPIDLAPDAGLYTDYLHRFGGAL